MKLKFRTVAILASLLFCALAIIWMFAPNLFLAGWGIAFSSSAELVGRRGGAVYAGVGLMFFWARNAEPSLTRSALVRGVVVGCLILATLGVYELAIGHASSGILSAVFIEIALVLALLYANRTDASLQSEPRTKHVA